MIKGIMSVKEHQEQILELVKSDFCVAEIARIVGHSENGVRHLLKRLGVQPKKKKIFNASVESIVERLKDTDKSSNKFCVYLHRKKSDNSIFYVGQGTESRPNNSSNRSQSWKNTVKESGGYTVEIVDKALSKAQALELEDFLIEQIHGIINLAHSKSEFNDIELSEIRDKFYYDETSPSFIRHKNDGHRIKANNPAGYQEKNKYWRVKSGKKVFLVHRIVFVLLGNTLDKNSIVDHIDGNPANNSISNLRKVTPGENCRNRKIRSDNKTGISGITRDADSYSSMVTLDGKAIKKSVSISKYGDEEAFRLIQEWRARMLSEINSTLQAGYTERHGT